MTGHDPWASNPKPHLETFPCVARPSLGVVCPSRQWFRHQNLLTEHYGEGVEHEARPAGNGCGAVWRAADDGLYGRTGTRADRRGADARPYSGANRRAHRRTDAGSGDADTRPCSAAGRNADLRREGHPDTGAAASRDAHAGRRSRSRRPSPSSAVTSSTFPLNTPRAGSFRKRTVGLPSRSPASRWRWPSASTS